MTSVKLYEKFIRNSGTVKIEQDQIIVLMKKKRDLPMLLESFKKSEEITIGQFENRPIVIKGHTTS